MKLVHVITGLNQGGAEKALLNFCILDAGSSHEIWVLKGRGFYSEVLASKVSKVHYFQISLNFFSLIKAIIFIYDQSKRKDIDIFMTWLYHADLVSVLIKMFNWKKKIFWTIHNLEVKLRDVKFSTLLVFKLNSFISRFVPTKIIYCANSAKIYHETFGYSKSKSAVIYNCASYIGISKDNVRKKILKKIKIGMAARYSPVKNFPLAIESVKNFAKNNQQYEIELVCCGSQVNDQNIELKNLAKNSIKNLKIKFIDVLQDMTTFYNDIHLLILTSHSEALPTVVIEALFSKVPVVATDVGDTREIISHYGVISKKNIRNFSIGIKIVISNYENYTKLYQTDDYEKHIDSFKPDRILQKHVCLRTH